jgi:pimeloyl-ACP methyl ester carboxylesterase
MLTVAAGSAALAYAGYVAAAYGLRNRIVYPVAGTPFGAFRSWPTEEATRLQREIEGGTVHAFHLEASAPRGRVAILHGNMMVAPDVAFLARFWTEQGFDVLVPEYRGYAGAAGKPEAQAIVDDVSAFLDELRPVVGPFIAQGISLGGGIAAELTRTRNVDALVLQSTFLSISSVTPRFGLPGRLVRTLYPTAQTLRNFAGRMLVIHGTADRLFPPSHGRQLAAIVPAGQARHVEVPNAIHMIADNRIVPILRDHVDWLAPPHPGAD